jgi:uncharacterized membrane protein
MLRRAHRLKLINCNKKGMFKLLGVGFVFLGLYFVLLIGDIYILPHMRIITTLLTNQPVNIYHFFNITGVIIAVLCLVHLATLPEVENHEHS